MSEKKSEYYWNEQVDYLRESRKDLWNQDYFAFLVKNVWKFEKPVRVVDFGCGMGYMGSVLLPLLPEGSTYTGLDMGSKLIEQGRETFAGSPWSVEFIEQDLTLYETEERFDLAVCQCVLVHIPSPVSVLEKMVRSVVAGGRVICIEPNWIYNNIGMYRHGMEVYSYEDAGVHQKILDVTLQRDKLDRYIGTKVPAMMHDLNLTNIDIRINDKARFRFFSPDKSKLQADRKARRESRESAGAWSIEGYMGMGFSRTEAIRNVESQLLTEDYENGYDGDLPIVDVTPYFISYGEK